MAKIRWIILGILIGYLLCAGISYISKEPIAESPALVVDKVEKGENHILILQKKVTPEEFIGYDAGDYYIVKNNDD